MKSLLSHSLAFLSAMLLSKWLMGRSDVISSAISHQEAALELQKSSTITPVARLISNYIDGGWWQTKEQFLTVFHSLPLYSHDNENLSPDAPFLDTVNCDNYTVLVSNEEWLPPATYSSRMLAPKFLVREGVRTEEDTSSSQFRCYLTTGFSKKTEICQWWYLWFSK